MLYGTVEFKKSDEYEGSNLKTAEEQVKRG
jgi:hypothetical protein